MDRGGIKDILFLYPELKPWADVQQVKNRMWRYWRGNMSLILFCYYFFIIKLV